MNTSRSVFVRGIPLQLVVTLVLSGMLTVLGLGLFFVFHLIVHAQTEQALRAETREWVDSLANSSATHLWNLDAGAIKVLGDGAVGNPLVHSLSIWNDRNELVFQRNGTGPILETLKREVRFGARYAGALELSSSALLVDARVAQLETPVFWAGGVFLLLVVLVTPLVLARSVLRPIHRLGRLLATVDPVTLPDKALTSYSRVREIRSVEKALRTLATAVRDNVQTLEERVSERSAALQSTRDQLAHAEALATLAQLTAGIAHGLNTPLAATLSASLSLQESLRDDVLPLLAEVLGTSVPEQPEAFLAALMDAASDLDSPRLRSRKNVLRDAWKKAGRDTESELFHLLDTVALEPLALRMAGWSSSPQTDRLLHWFLLNAELLEVIRLSAEKGAHVVESLRWHLAAGEPGAQTWFDGAIRLNDAIDRCHGQPGCRTEIRREYPSDLRLFGSQNRLAQVWLNLLRNACQSAGPDGWVAVSAKLTEDWAEVRISDSGPPVAPEHLSRLFEPYFTTRPMGLGLGLPLSRTMMEALGGHLVYEHEPLPTDKVNKAFVARWPVKGPPAG